MTAPTLTFLPMDQDKSEVDINPSRVEKWLASLNFTHAIECAQIILDVLQKTNRVEMISAPVRQRLMELYLVSFEKVLAPLKKELEHPAVLSNSHGRLAVKTIELFLEALFTGFRLCLVAKINLRSVKTRMNYMVKESDQGKIVLANTALMCARQLVNWSAQYHTHVPKGVWLYCHELYELICYYGWQDVVNNEKTSLSGMYRQILLIAMLPADLLNFTTFEWLRNAILTRESSLTFGQVDQTKKYKGSFYFATNIDSPPCFLHNVPSLSEGWQVIDASIISSELKHLLVGLERNSSIAQQSTEVEGLRILLMEWTQPVRRSHVQVVSKKMWVQTQLSRICYLLRNKNSSTHLGEKIDQLLVKKPVLIQQVNDSDSSLIFDGDTNDQIIRVGELVLCSEEESNFESYFLAWTRWFMINKDGQTLKFGVERISSQIEVVSLVDANEQQDQRPISAILIPPKLRKGRGPLLIIPGRNFVRLKEFIMINKDDEHKSIRLMTLSAQTPIYQLVGFLDSEDL